jgi:hypothetical protein
MRAVQPALMGHRWILNSERLEPGLGRHLLEVWRVVGVSSVTAADYLAEAAVLARQAALYESLTAQHTLLGRVFDYNAPLPPQPNYRPREWETDTKDKP